MATLWETMNAEQKALAVIGSKAKGLSYDDIAIIMGAPDREAIRQHIHRYDLYVSTRRPKRRDPERIMEHDRLMERETFWPRAEMVAMNQRALARMIAVHPDLCPPELKAEVLSGLSAAAAAAVTAEIKQALPVRPRKEDADT